MTIREGEGMKKGGDMKGEAEIRGQRLKRKDVFSDAV